MKSNSLKIFVLASLLLGVFIGDTFAQRGGGGYYTARKKQVEKVRVYMRNEVETGIIESYASLNFGWINGSMQLGGTSLYSSLRTQSEIIDYAWYDDMFTMSAEYVVGTRQKKWLFYGYGTGFHYRYNCYEELYMEGNNNYYYYHYDYYKTMHELELPIFANVRIIMLSRYLVNPFISISQGLTFGFSSGEANSRIGIGDYTKIEVGTNFRATNNIGVSLSGYFNVMPVRCKGSVIYEVQDYSELIPIEVDKWKTRGGFGFSVGVNF